METHNILEINLISAQGLKLPSSNKRRFQMYALAWINSSTKLRTRVDKVDAENPTWNDRFLFKVSPEFLSSETSAVSVEIYSVGYLRDHIVGSVRFLISNIALSASKKTPSFTAFQIRRPSGRIHGLLNISAMLIDDSEFVALTRVSAIAYCDLMGESKRENKRHGELLRKSKSMVYDFNTATGSGSESLENSSSCGGSPRSDGGDSMTSSSSTASTVLKDWNGSGMPIPGAARKPRVRSISTGTLCGLFMERKSCLSPTDQNLVVQCGSPEMKE